MVLIRDIDRYRIPVKQIRHARLYQWAQARRLVREGWPSGRNSYLRPGRRGRYR